MRRLIEHQVAVRASGALNLFIDTCPWSFGFRGFFVPLQQKVGQWKFSGDKHNSLQVDTERTFHQRYPLVML